MDSRFRLGAGETSGAGCFFLYTSFFRSVNPVIFCSLLYDGTFFPLLLPGQEKEWQRDSPSSIIIPLFIMPGASPNSVFDTTYHHLPNYPFPADRSMDIFSLNAVFLLMFPCSFTPLSRLDFYVFFLSHETFKFFVHL